MGIASNPLTGFSSPLYGSEGSGFTFLNLEKLSSFGKKRSEKSLGQLMETTNSCHQAVPSVRLGLGARTTVLWELSLTSPPSPPQSTHMFPGAAPVQGQTNILVYNRIRPMKCAPRTSKLTLTLNRWRELKDPLVKFFLDWITGPFLFFFSQGPALWPGFDKPRASGQAFSRPEEAQTGCSRFRCARSRTGSQAQPDRPANTLIGSQ